MRFISKKWAALAAVLAVGGSLMVGVLAAMAMSVQPIILDLLSAGRRTSAVITVENTFATPLTVEALMNEAVVDVNGLRATEAETDDLLVFPPQALIPPGQTQTFRVQYLGDPAITASKHYTVTMSQLPVELPDTESAIQILYNFQVAVSVGIPGLQSALTVSGTEIEVGEDGKPRPVVIFQNASSQHGYVSQGTLRVIQKDAAGAQVFDQTFTPEEFQQNIGFGLVGANGTRRMLIPVVLPSADGPVTAEYRASRG